MKLQVFILLCYCVAYLICEKNKPKPLRDEFNNKLESFINKMNGTKLPPPKFKAKACSASNMRKTSNFARENNKIMEFSLDFIYNQTEVEGNFEEIRISAELCPFKPIDTCNPSSKYHSFDGSCNNLVFPLFGKSDTPYTRLLPAIYEDGFNSPRKNSKLGGELPNPRLLSLAVSNVPQSNPDPVENSITNLFPAFGQFVTHDMTGASVVTGIKFKLAIKLN